MAMEISNYYNNYANSYTNTENSKKQETEKTGKTRETAEIGTTRKTAADELSYLSKKFSNYSFVSANYTMGMRYGSNATTNVAISPQFLEKMANDPELEKEYEKQIAGMQKCDEEFIQREAASGWSVVAQGWAIDKDGGISGWVITRKDSNAKSHLQTMSENAEKIRKQNEEKKEEKEKIEEKRQAAREEKTAKDELAYLSKKYSDYSFVSANYTMGMKYGSNATTNVAISPQFLAKMANDSKLGEEYEKEIANMQKLDAEEDARLAGSGWHIVARGWVIDKDGGISKWGITQKDDKKSHLQTMSENVEKIRKQNEEKKKEKVKIEEKRQEDKEELKKLQKKMEEIGKEKFGDKWKGVTVTIKEDENAVVSHKAGKSNVKAAGVNFDLTV